MPTVYAVFILGILLQRRVWLNSLPLLGITLIWHGSEVTKKIEWQPWSLQENWYFYAREQPYTLWLKKKIQRNFILSLPPSLNLYPDS